MAKTVLCGVALALVLALAGPVVAQDEVGISIGADLVSDYLWRGQLRNGDGALQPWAEVDFSGFTFNVWGSMDLDDEPNDSDFEFTELDLTGSYSIPVGEVYTLDVGAIYYDFPNTDAESTIEVFGTFTLTDVTFTPYVSLYYDIDEVEGFYLQIGGSYGQELETLNWKVDVSLGAGSEDYNESYFGTDSFALNDLTATFTVAFPFSEQLEVTAFVSGSLLLDSDIEDAVADDSNFAAGAGVSYTF